MKTFLTLALIGALSTTSLAAAPRRWTDKTGRYTVQAELIDHGSDEITLKKADGKTVRVAVSDLSRQDQLYLSEEPGAGKGDRSIFPIRESRHLLGTIHRWPNLPFDSWLGCATEASNRIRVAH